MWEMISVWDGTTLVSSHPTTIATLVFTDDTASGSTGCNLFESVYAIGGDAIVFGDLALTGSDCDSEYADQDSTMVRALRATSHFVRSEDRLELIDAEGTTRLQFRPAGELPLAGITWRLVWYRGGTSPLHGTEISLAFDPEGTLTGIAGCNTYSADYRVDDDLLRTGAIAQTEQECTEPEGVMQQESDYLDALRRTHSFATTLTRLDLFDPDGTTIAELRFAGRIRAIRS